MHEHYDLFPLIQLLADGRVHSGQSLGQQLGITRAAVWKRLQQIESIGLRVDSVKGRGYCLTEPLQLLDEDVIASSMSASAAELLDQLECHFELPSTNQQLMWVAQSDPRVMVCLAERQTAGRGRRGRNWHSPFGANLYLSVRWPYANGVAAFEGLSLAVGVIIAEVLEQWGLKGASLKWPNDLLCDGRKLGGILIEVSGDLSGEGALVVGVGLNVRMPQSDQPLIDQPYTDLFSQGVEAERSKLCAALLSALLPALEGYPADGFAAYRQRWSSRAAYMGEYVDVCEREQRRTGVLRGVDHRGALEVELADGIVWLAGGEISVRANSR